MLKKTFILQKDRLTHLVVVVIGGIHSSGMQRIYYRLYIYDRKDSTCHLAIA